MVSQWNHAILTDALPTFSICSRAQKSSLYEKIYKSFALGNALFHVRITLYFATRLSGLKVPLR